MSLFRKAERRKAKLRLAITGTAGSGKTYGALLVAQGLGGRIAMLDSENGSGDLYSNLCDYDILPLKAPYDIRKYLSAIHEAEKEGYSVLIIDSLSHAWSGEGGLLDVKEQLASNGKLNSFTAWNKITPMQNKLIEAILTSPCHIIATIRSKTDYVQVVNDRGKTEIRKVGLAPIQRPEIEYEFSVVMDLSSDHIVSVSKDRTSLFDNQNFMLSNEVGEKLLEYLNSGVEVVDEKAINERKSALYHSYLKLFQDTPQEAQRLAQEAIMSVTGGRGSKEWTVQDLNNLEADVQNRINNVIHEELAQAS